MENCITYTKLEIESKVLAKLPLAVLSEDVDRNIRVANQAFCDIFKISVSPDKLIGLNVLKLQEEKKDTYLENERVSKRVNQIIKNLKPVNDLEVQLVDGTHISVHYVPCFENDVLLGHIWCYTDTTEVKKLEIKNENQKHFFEDILNNIPADIVVFNQKHQYNFINDTAIKNPEVKEWLIGKDDFDYCELKGIKTDMAEGRRNKFLESVNNKKDVEWEDVIDRKDDVKEYILRRFHPAYKPNGEVNFVIGYGINIDELKNKEIELFKTESKYQTVVAQLNEVVFRLSFSGEIEFLNPAWENLLGYKINDCIGESLMDFIYPEDIHLKTESHHLLLTDQIVNSKLNLRFITKSGGIRWMSLFCTKIPNNISIGIWGTLNDITELKTAEIGLLKTINQERHLNELKSNFVNMVSHEFRTPLAGILSSVELLELIHEKENLQLAPSFLLHFERIKNQINRMSDLMNDVLLLGKIESGKLDFKPVKINLLKFYDEIVRNNFAHKTNILELTTVGKPCEITADFNALKHIFINLIDNALKYSNKKEAKVKIYLIYHVNFIEIRVEDNGIGIPQKEQKKLFTAFFRASNAGNIEGTGLGLIVVKHFVDLHKGGIQVESKTGKGCIFSIKLPKAIDYEISRKTI